MSGLTAKIYCPLTNNVYKNINTNMRLISCMVYAHNNMCIYYTAERTYTGFVRVYYNP